MSAPAAAWFPLVRHLSSRATPWLARLPVTPNQITAASLALGLACNALLTRGTPGWNVAAGILLVACYVLDNCDGEIARLKGQGSEFGRRFDTFVDFVVHTSFFPALALGASASHGEGVGLWLGVSVWHWLGGLAALGSTLNYAFSLRDDLRRARRPAPQPAPRSAEAGEARPESPLQWLAFVVRELTRADFCFLVLLLGAADALWPLLPAGAIGAQVYWVLRFVRGADEYHV